MDKPFLRPSSIYRLFHCPASYWLNLTEPNNSGEAAAKGTRIHNYVEQIVNKGIKGVRLKYGKYDAEEVTLTNKVISIVEKLFDIIKPEEIACEIKVDVSDIGCGSGTCDLAAWVGEDLYIIDYKTGFGKVSGNNNSQLKAYSLGVYKKLKGKYNFKRIHNIIIQPTVYYKYGYSYSRYSIEDLLTWEENEYKPLEQKIVSRDMTMKVGSHCRYCPANLKCEAVNKLVSELVSLNQK